MEVQSNIKKSNFTNFLQAGSILQTSLDQFKVIWGPFSPVDAVETQLSDEKTVIFQPNFWDFIDHKSASAVMGIQEMVLNRSELIELLKSEISKETNWNWDPCTQSDFIEQFQWSFQQFSSGDLVKTVPIISQQANGSFGFENLAAALLSLLNENHYGTTYGIWSDGSGFLGQTPELVAQWDQVNKKLVTMALAGTAALGNEALILKDLKIRQEHQIVVNDILSVLEKKMHLESVQVNPTEVLVLKHLTHLLTQIAILDVELKQALQILNSLPPTAALGIFPRHEKHYREFQRIGEQQNRNNFAAPFGFLNRSNLKVVAAIRNFYFSKDSIKIFSGCGVTTESDLEAELAELENKRNSVKRMMGFNQ